MPSAALSISGLAKRYDDGTLALDALDLEVPAGSFFGLLGPNGAGQDHPDQRGLQPAAPDRGEISVFGLPGASLEARRLIGIAEQEPNLDRFLTVRETLVYHGGYYGMTRAAAAERAEQMIEVFDLASSATSGRRSSPAASGAACCWRGRCCTSRAW